VSLRARDSTGNHEEFRRKFRDRRSRPVLFKLRMPSIAMSKLRISKQHARVAPNATFRPNEPLTA
jgi:hypothetical protein